MGSSSGGAVRGPSSIAAEPRAGPLTSLCVVKQILMASRGIGGEGGIGPTLMMFRSVLSSGIRLERRPKERREFHPTRLQEAALVATVVHHRRNFRRRSASFPCHRGSCRHCEMSSCLLYRDLAVAIRNSAPSSTRMTRRFAGDFQASVAGDAAGKAQLNGKPIVSSPRGRLDTRRSGPSLESVG